MKKRSIILLVIVLVLAIACMMVFVACDKSGNDNPNVGGDTSSTTPDNNKPDNNNQDNGATTKVPPVYKGMSVSAATNNVALADEVVPDYDAIVGENVLVTVHFDNEDQFEILSFMLNDKKYAVQQFLPGSTIDDLIISLNVGETLGVQRHVISAIKYIDGEDIKDVKLDGKTYIDINVYKKFSGITFEDSNVLYDGKPHRIEVKGLPEGATCTYTGNDVVEVGNHTVTATISQDGYKDLVLTATLNIVSDNKKMSAGELVKNDIKLVAKDISLNGGKLKFSLDNIDIAVERYLEEDGSIHMTIKYYNMAINMDKDSHYIFELLWNYIKIPNYSFDGTMLNNVRKIEIVTEYKVEKDKITALDPTFYHLNKLMDANGKLLFVLYDGAGNPIGDVYKSGNPDIVHPSNETIYNELSMFNADILKVVDSQYELNKDSEVKGAVVPSKVSEVIEEIFGTGKLSTNICSMLNYNKKSNTFKMDNGYLVKDVTGTMKVTIPKATMVKLLDTIKVRLGVDLTKPMVQGGGTLEQIVTHLTAGDIIMNVEIVAHSQESERIAK